MWLHHRYLVTIAMVRKYQCGYIDPAISVSCVGEKSRWLHNSYLLRIPKVVRNQCGCITTAFSGSPSWG